MVEYKDYNWRSLFVIWPPLVMSATLKIRAHPLKYNANDSSWFIRQGSTVRLVEFQSRKLAIASTEKSLFGLIPILAIIVVG